MSLSILCFSYTIRFFQYMCMLVSLLPRILLSLRQELYLTHLCILSYTSHIASHTKSILKWYPLRRVDKCGTIYGRVKKQN